VTFDISRFFPVLRNATLGLHALFGASTGALPPNKLFTFSDQQLRGYADPFYGTDIQLYQAELRLPLTRDRKYSIVLFGDDGAVRIRGGTQINSDSTTTDLNQFAFHSDVGLGLRFDVPQLGLKTIRLDFAKGAQGGHTSFGIGQSF
jgi:outer membrane protein assembly factor BamA